MVFLFMISRRVRWTNIDSCVVYTNNIITGKSLTYWLMIFCMYANELRQKFKFEVKGKTKKDPI